MFLQFWNLFIAKAFHSGIAVFRDFGKNVGGFELALVIILIGQVLIVTFGGEMFSVEPLCWRDWLICFVGTSPVLIVGEIIRFFVKDNN